MLLGQWNRAAVAAFAAFLLISSAYLSAQRHSVNGNLRLPPLVSPKHSSATRLPCRELSGADDTVVVLKTGSTELQDKLPVHLRTTLRCYPNRLIFSDLAEQYRGERILDALEEVDPMIKASHQDFVLYRQLQTSGRAALHIDQLSGPASLPEEGTSGKLTNPGWKLDKWKFLPMIRRTLEEYPNKQWYVFLETDTYIMWGTLLAYLAALDSSKPYYIGSQSQIGDVIFAHGGSGFVASRSALASAVAHYAENKAKWEKFTAAHWAGDRVLGKLFKDSGTSLTWAWPIWQGDQIGNMEYARVSYGHTLWCCPTVSYHHLNPSVIDDLWNFEQDWFSEHRENSSLLLRHRDIYAKFILPRILDPRQDWNNLADNDRGSVSSLDECRAICQNDFSCVQYSLGGNGRCLKTSDPKLGETSPGVRSGWLFERMQEFYDKAKPCGKEEWIM